MPTQQSFRLNEEVPESSAREQLCECRQNCPICWFQHWSLYLSSEDCHLVAQHDDLNCEVGISSTNESDQLEDAAERPVREGEGSRPDPRRPGVQPSKCRSWAVDGIYGTHRVLGTS